MEKYSRSIGLKRQNYESKLAPHCCTGTSMINSPTSSLTIEKDTALDNDIMLPSEVAKKLRISTKTLSRLTKRGEIPSRKVGGQYRYFKTDLDRWLKGDSE